MCGSSLRNTPAAAQILSMSLLFLDGPSLPSQLLLRVKHRVPQSYLNADAPFPNKALCFIEKALGYIFTLDKKDQGDLKICLPLDKLLLLCMCTFRRI